MVQKFQQFEAKTAFQGQNLTGILNKKTQWFGEKSPSEGTWEEFTDAKWSLRATFILIKNYVERHNLRNIEQVVSRWRFGQNDPNKLGQEEKEELNRYLDFVKKITGNLTLEIPIRDITGLFEMVQGITMWESGNQLSGVVKLPELIVKSFEAETDDPSSPPAYKAWKIDINSEDYKKQRAAYLQQKVVGQQEENRPPEPKEDKKETPEKNRDSESVDISGALNKILGT